MLSRVVPTPMSLSARRAWIEIVGGAIAAYPVFLSLSARRAWIEIPMSPLPRSGTVRSLSARRAWIEIGVMEFGPGEVFGRSPQGERG